MNPFVGRTVTKHLIITGQQVGNVIPCCTLNLYYTILTSVIEITFQVNLSRVFYANIVRVVEAKTGRIV